MGEVVCECFLVRVFACVATVYQSCACGAESIDVRNVGRAKFLEPTSCRTGPMQLTHTALARSTYSFLYTAGHMRTICPLPMRACNIYTHRHTDCGHSQIPTWEQMEYTKTFNVHGLDGEPCTCLGCTILPKDVRNAIELYNWKSACYDERVTLPILPRSSCVSSIRLSLRPFLLTACGIY